MEGDRAAASAQGMSFLPRNEGRMFRYDVGKPWMYGSVIAKFDFPIYKTDEAFWKGCEGCVNHDILMAKNRKFCICTAMLYDPSLHEEDTI